MEEDGGGGSPAQGSKGIPRKIASIHEGTTRKFTDRLLTQEWHANPTEQAHTLVWLKDQATAAIPGADVPTCIQAVADAKDITTDRVKAILELRSFEDIARAIVARPKGDLRLPGEEMYPSTGWIGEYLRFAQGNEVPLAFHFWTAVTTLGAAARRNFFLDMGVFRIFPNHYTMLIANSGVKKGTALSVGMDILSRLNLILHQQGKTEEHERIRMLPQKMGPEILLNLMKSVPLKGGHPDHPDTEWSESVAFMGVPELAVLIGKQVFHSDMMVQILTDLYDCHDVWQSGTMARRLETLHNVAISLIWCSTPDWISESCTPEMFKGGFMARMMTCWRETSGRSFPRADYLDPVSAHELARRLVPISTASRRWMPVDSWDWYEEWYHQNKQRLVEEHNPKMQGYLNRKDNHMLSLAMVLALSEERFTITTKDMQQALRYLEEEERVTFPKLFGKMDRHEDDEKAERVAMVIYDWKKDKDVDISRTQLLAKCSWFLGGHIALDKMLAELRQREWIKTLPPTEGKRGVHYHTTLTFTKRS